MKYLAIMAWALFSIPRPLCSQETDLPIRWTTRGPAESPFIAVTGVASTPSGDIWVSDARAGTVYVFDQEGHFRFPVGMRGDGPGEFRGPTFISTFKPDLVAVLDLGHRSIEIFDSSGAHVRRVHHGVQIFHPKSFLALPDSGFLVTGGVYGNQGSLHSFSWEGSLLSSDIPRPETSDPMASLYISGGPIVRLEDGLLVLSSASQHQLLTIRRGKRVSLLAEDKSVFPAIGDGFIQRRGEDVRFRWLFPRPTGLFVLGDGTLLNVITWRDRDLSIWERYRMNGDLISRTEVPVAYYAWGVLPGGDMVVSRVDSGTGEAEVLRVGMPWDGEN